LLLWFSSSFAELFFDFHGEFELYHDEQTGALNKLAGAVFGTITSNDEGMV